MELSDTYLEFGPQVYGETAEQTLVVRNLGMPGHTLYVYYFVEDGSHFSITDPDQEIALEPGAGWQARVRFHATRTGSLESRIILFASYYPFDQDREVDRQHIRLSGQARQFCPIPGEPTGPMGEYDGKKVRLSSSR